MRERYNVNHYEYGEYLEMSPLRRLRNDFNLCRDDIAATMTLLRYIKDEFTHPDSRMDANEDDVRREVYAERLLATFRDQGLFPVGEVYEISPSDAVDMYRIGFFKAFTSLEANLRDSEEFEAWLSDAFEFILPPGDRHQPDVCLTGGTMFEETCYAGNWCPVKAVANAIEVELSSPDFSSYDYEADADKAFRTRMLLLDQIASRDFVGPYKESQLESSYQAKFTAAFSISR